MRSCCGRNEPRGLGDEAVVSEAGPDAGADPGLGEELEIFLEGAGDVVFAAAAHAEEIFAGEERLDGFDVGNVDQHGAMDADEAVAGKFFGDDGDLFAEQMGSARLLEQNVVALSVGGMNFGRIEEENFAAALDGDAVNCGGELRREVGVFVWSSDDAVWNSAGAGGLGCRVGGVAEGDVERAVMGDRGRGAGGERGFQGRGGGR
jgi:hypothetical protein